MMIKQATNDVLTIFAPMKEHKKNLMALINEQTRKTT